MQHSSLAASLSSLLLLSLATSAFASEAPPPGASVAHSCDTLTGDARKECDRVANEMKKSAQRSDGADDAKAVGMHSSPVMIDDKEKAVKDANRKGKDPRKAVEKIEAKDAPTAEKK